MISNMRKFNQNKPNVQKIIVNGVLYASVKEAAEKLGCCHKALRRKYREFLQGSLSEGEIGVKICKKLTITKIK